MKRMLMVIVALQAVALLIFPYQPVAADYWPLKTGSTFHYETPSGEWWDVEYQEAAIEEGYYWRSGVGGPDACTFEELYYCDEAGDVLFERALMYCEGWVDPDFPIFEPPMLLLDLPLEVGKSWHWEGSCGIIFFTVVGDEVVSLPAGTFDTVKLEVTNMTCCWPVTTMYLHRQLGPVKWEEYELISWTGIVLAEPSTWGSVKAMYR